MEMFHVGWIKCYCPDSLLLGTAATLLSVTLGKVWFRLTIITSSPTVSGKALPLPRLRRAGLPTACYRSTCLRVLSFIQLPFRSICISSASLSVEWRIQNPLVTKSYVKTCFCSLKQTATWHTSHRVWKQGVQIEHANVWIWIAIIQHTESTWIPELLVTRSSSEISSSFLFLLPEPVLL